MGGPGAEAPWLQYEGTMNVLERYLLRQATVAFLATLVVLTGVVWVTQALREFDLVTAQGQTLWTFLLVTALAIPSLALVVAPISLFAAVAYTLNRLNADSELASLAAAGVTPFRLMRPFLILTLLVAVLVAGLSFSAIPSSLRMLKQIVSQIRADVVVNVMREGAFTTLEDGVTLHVRARGKDGSLLGIFVDDSRDPKQNIIYTAERGRIAETEEGTYLVLEKGAVQRKEQNARDAAIVVFERYAFDLSPLTANKSVTSYKPRERYTSELLKLDPNDPAVRQVPGRFRAELHERLVNPLYPVAFMAITFAILGRPRTTRQNRYVGLALAFALVFGLRIAGLGMTNLIARSESAVPLLYLVPLAATLASLMFTFVRLPRLSLPWASRPKAA